MSVDTWRMPYSITTERLVLRRYEASDAEQMSRVTLAAKAHLEPWMPWARAEPLPADERAALIERFMREFDEGSDFVMGIFTHTGEYLGGTGLLTRRGAGVLEVGYWIAPEHQGKGYITEATKALTLVALRYCGAELVELLHDPDNARSSRVPQRCGFTYQGDEFVALDPASEPEVTSVWSFSAPDLAANPQALGATPSLRDATGQLLTWQS